MQLAYTTNAVGKDMMRMILKGKNVKEEEQSDHRSIPMALEIFKNAERIFPLERTLSWIAWLQNGTAANNPLGSKDVSILPSMIKSDLNSNCCNCF